MNHETLRNWVKISQRGEATPSDTAPGGSGEELRALRKRVAELELEKDLLRKAAAYFAKEMGR